MSIQGQKSPASTEDFASDKLSFVNTYASLLTTPSYVMSLDHQPLPWFSSEVRLAHDPRIRWLTLEEWISEAEPGVEGSQSPSEMMHLSRQPSNSLIDTADEPTKSSSDADQAVAGHYLDHIEAVQQRDQDHQKSSKQKKRRKKARTTSRASANVNQTEVTSQVLPNDQGESMNRGPTHPTGGKVDDSSVPTPRSRSRRPRRGKSS